MPNESLSEREPEKNLDTPEPVKPSKLKRIKSTAITVGIYTIPVAVLGGTMFASWKMTTIQFETAKMNLEAAKLNSLAEAVTEKS
jgi:hypothetical protein